MQQAIRALVPPVLVAAALTALLALWIRSEPVDLRRAAQVGLSAGLVVAIAGLLLLVLRVERGDPRQ